MPDHSRSKNGVASLAYVPGIHIYATGRIKTWMAGTSPVMTGTARMQYTADSRRTGERLRGIG
jgi:hypothetical protein